MKYKSQNPSLIVHRVGKFIDGVLDTDDKAKMDILANVEGVERVEEKKTRAKRVTKAAK